MIANDLKASQLSQNSIDKSSLCYIDF